MEQSQSLGILFYVRNDKERKDGTVPIFLGITVQGKRAELSVRRYVHKDKWDSSAGRAKGTNEDSKRLNTFLRNFLGRVERAEKTLYDNGDEITAANLKNILVGSYKTQKTLLEVFEHHNRMMKMGIPDDYAEATLTRYETTKRHLESFLQHEYNRTDIPLRRLDHAFVVDLENYFKHEKNCNHNTTAKYIKNLKKVIHEAIKNKWLDKDPFLNYQVKIKEVKREYLTREELDVLERKKIEILRLDLVRDLFVFSCYYQGEKQVNKSY